jgi:hypothetical protein
VEADVDVDDVVEPLAVVELEDVVEVLVDSSEELVVGVELLVLTEEVLEVVELVVDWDEFIVVVTVDAAPLVNKTAAAAIITTMITITATITV